MRYDSITCNLCTHTFFVGQAVKTDKIKACVFCGCLFSDEHTFVRGKSTVLGELQMDS